MFAKKQGWLLLCLPLAQLALAAQQIDDGTYFIRNAATGKVLDRVEGEAASQENLIQDAKTGVASQQWRVHYLGGNTYSLESIQGGYVAVDIKSQHHHHSLIDVMQNMTPPPKWTITDQGNGYFKVSNPQTGRVMQGERAENNTVLQGEDKGVNKQRWAFQSLDTGAAYDWPIKGNLGTHDPTAMQENGDWYEFQTGVGIYRKVSHDGGITWLPLPSVLLKPLSWWSTYAPDQTPMDVWAPDVKKYHDKVWLYYAISSFGTRKSAIGLLSAPSLKSDQWTDEGMVLHSTPASDFNAIDPDLVVDINNQPWLVFGSWWSGIKLTRLDEETMKPIGQLYSLASRSGGIEAPSITYRNGYYYLFVSTGKCCQGVNSTYQIRYGRSTRITGPYLDQQGEDMMKGGGSLLDTSHGRWIGPGGQDIVGNHIIVKHAYDANDNGNPKLRISRLNWDVYGWPRY